MTEHSPVGYTAAEQAAVHDELKEFLGSDDDDSDDEEDEDYVDDGEEDDDAGNDSEEEPAALASPESRKRKREGDEEAEGESEGAGTAPLAQRLKRTAGDDGEDTSKQDTMITTRPSDEDDSYNQSSYTENADYDEDELEREMLAAFENGDFDENAKDAIGADNG